MYNFFSMAKLPYGKLKPEELEKMLGRVKAPRGSGVLLGPRLGEDAAAVRVGGETLVVATDPITFATDEIGAYAVTVNANDVAVTGARPRWLQVCLLMPPVESRRMRKVFDSIVKAAGAAGVAVTGGHTEITLGIDRPIVIGTMLGTLVTEKLIHSGGARRGDALVLVKRPAIEGTAILAREKRKELLREFGAAFVRRCARFLVDPGISVVEPALAAARAGAHALHDPTEGGILSGAYEMARAANLGLTVDAELVPVWTETVRLCEYFRLDPLGLIASGSLLAAFDEKTADAFIRRCRRFGGAWKIGKFVGDAVVLKRNGATAPLEPTGADEILKAL